MSDEKVPSVEDWLAVRGAGTLPEGTTGLPNRNDIDPTWSRGDIQTGPQPTAEQEAVGLANLHLMSTDSLLLGRPILNFLDIWEHIQLEQAGAEPIQMNKRGRPRKPVDSAKLAADAARRQAYAAWQQVCVERRAAILAAKAELSNRKTLRAEALAKWHAASKQWDDYVRAAEAQRAAAAAAWERELSQGWDPWINEQQNKVKELEATRAPPQP